MAKPANPSLYAKAKAIVKKRVKKWLAHMQAASWFNSTSMGGKYK